jgi:hypothetical protein
MVDPDRLRAAAPLMYDALKARRAVSLHDPDCEICTSLGAPCMALTKLHCLAYMLQEDALMQVAGCSSFTGPAQQPPAERRQPVPARRVE